MFLLRVQKRWQSTVSGGSYALINVPGDGELKDWVQRFRYKDKEPFAGSTVSDYGGNYALKKTFLVTEIKGLGSAY